MRFLDGGGRHVIGVGFPQNKWPKVIEHLLDVVDAQSSVRDLLFSKSGGGVSCGEAGGGFRLLAIGSHSSSNCPALDLSRRVTKRNTPVAECRENQQKKRPDHHQNATSGKNGTSGVVARM